MCEVKNEAICGENLISFLILGFCNSYVIFFCIKKLLFIKMNFYMHQRGLILFYVIFYSHNAKSNPQEMGHYFFDVIFFDEKIFLIHFNENSLNESNKALMKVTSYKLLHNSTSLMISRYKTLSKNDYIHSVINHILMIRN